MRKKFIEFLSKNYDGKIKTEINNKIKEIENKVNATAESIKKKKDDMMDSIMGNNKEEKKSDNSKKDIFVEFCEKQRDKHARNLDRITFYLIPCIIILLLMLLHL